jgi:hypothetical protein
MTVGFDESDRARGVDAFTLRGNDRRVGDGLERRLSDQRLIMYRRTACNRAARARRRDDALPAVR